MSATEKMEFRTELKQLLHLITHSLYSNKEIFLRELISNASDAINKIKFDSLQHEERLEGNKDWKIKITPNKAIGTLTISDNGIGLSKQDAIENLGTIARSGTRVFLESLKAASQTQRPDLIGQFGVGFYSAFMVADRVTVLSRPAGSPAEGVRWESDGQGEFTVADTEKATRGTDVILHLKKEEHEFLDPFRLQEIIRKFSDFIEHPVVMDMETEEDGQKKIAEQTINSRKALWLRSKSENTPEEYNTFYKQIASDIHDPAKVIHYTAEGNQEFKVLAFIPSEKPLDMQWGEYKWGMRLYVQRVMIMDHCEALLPAYLRFVKGVVDSSDLPLNISRELLQQNPLLEQIRNNVTRSILDALAEMKDKENEKYLSFFRELGSLLKEGPGRDRKNKDRIADLLLFESLKTPAGQFTTLAGYVLAMPAEQKEIYYLIGETREQLENSPYLETYRDQGFDVLLLTDPVDEFLMPGLGEYKGKKFVAADRAGSPPAAEEQGEFAAFFTYIKSKLPEISDVRLSTRLKDSACCLVTEQGAMSAHFERLMQKWGRGGEVEGNKRILEINADHAAVKALRTLHGSNAEDARLESSVRLLYDQAVIAEGSRVKDPVGLSRRINELLVKSIGVVS